MEPGTTVLLKGRVSPQPIYTEVRLPPTEPIAEPEPEYETRVIGVTEEGHPIVQQIPTEGAVKGYTEPTPAPRPEPAPTWRETTVTGQILGMEETGLAAGFVGTFESYLRPEVPTVPGAVMEHLTVRGYPRSLLYPEYMVPKDRDKMISGMGGWVAPAPYDIPPRDPYAELKQLGPGYITGALLGEATQAYLFYKAGQKLLPTKKKVVTETTHIVPRKEPYAWIGKEPSKTMLMPLEQTGAPMGYKITVEPGVRTPFKTIVSGGQQLLMVEQQLPRMTVTSIPRSVYAGKELVKQATRGAVRVVSKPSRMAYAIPFVAQLPKAWRYEPYPGTRQKVTEEVEIVSYEGTEAPTRLKPKPSTLYHEVRRLEKLPTELRPIAESGMKPLIGTVPKTVLRGETRTRTEATVQQIARQQERQMLRYIQVPRYLQIQRTRLAPPAMKLRLPKHRAREGRGRFGRAWFMREYPIRPPTEILSKPKRRKRTRAKKRKRRR